VIGYVLVAIVVVAIIALGLRANKKRSDARGPS
jgi:hypothetical protein